MCTPFLPESAGRMRWRRFSTSNLDTERHNHDPQLRLSLKMESIVPAVNPGRRMSSKRSLSIASGKGSTSGPALQHIDVGRKDVGSAEITKYVEEIGSSQIIQPYREAQVARERGAAMELENYAREKETAMENSAAAERWSLASDTGKERAISVENSCAPAQLYAEFVRIPPLSRHLRVFDKRIRCWVS